MTFGEAISQLDDPAENDPWGYGRMQATRKTKMIWILKSKHGLARCTHDWPTSYSPSLEDLNATDWEIESPKDIQP